MPKFVEPGEAHVETAWAGLDFVVGVGAVGVEMHGVALQTVVVLGVDAVPGMAEVAVADAVAVVERV